MIKLENYEVVGWKHAIRGMRNPLNSWERSDSIPCADITCKECRFNDKPEECRKFGLNSIILGKNDHDLMMRLAHGGPVHAKYRRMITVYVDITAPLYWWKEFDTYKVGTVANSCSTMHKIHAKEFVRSDFSIEDLVGEGCIPDHVDENPFDIMELTIGCLNYLRDTYLELKKEHKDDKAKLIWRNMIQMLPSSYNQKRTVMLNYEVLTNIYNSRKGHKLTEWVNFLTWIEQLPYSEIITGPANRIAEGEAGLGPKGPEGLKDDAFITIVDINEIGKNIGEQTSVYDPSIETGFATGLYTIEEKEDEKND